MITKSLTKKFITTSTSYLYKELCDELCVKENYRCLEESFNEIKDKLNMSLTYNEYLNILDKLKPILDLDIEAAYDGDPAAKNKEEIIVSYPGFFATMVYRIAHELYLLNIPILPRMASEIAHTMTGIDINPGAKIGTRFFIDHGTGVVIGETAEVGNNVRLYQGVTLGAKSLINAHELRDKKRHPTIKDNVIIYAGASILGGDTVIGNNVIIGSNVFLTSSVADNKMVRFERDNYSIKDRN